MKARMFIAFAVMLAAGYMIFQLAAAGEANSLKETGRVKDVIDKALVQCYALEGSYPANIEHLASYGVILDNDRYFYVYDMIFTNIRPTVSVVIK